MATVCEHYDNLLANYYSWMFGDFDAKVANNAEFFSAHGIAPGQSGLAVDLGAGPGFQSLALALLGFGVVAIDLSRRLLDELEEKRGNLPVTAVQGDMLEFAAHLPGPAELCVCMGDTLPHLETFEDVETLVERVYQALVPGGRFVVTYRDLSCDLTGLARFIPVKSDENTIFSCFLEYAPHTVTVHDLVYTRLGTRWEFSKSSYQKLRLPLDPLLGLLEDCGFIVEECRSNGGMVTIIAARTT